MTELHLFLLPAELFVPTIFCPLNNCSLQIPGSHTELSPDSEGAEAVPALLFPLHASLVRNCCFRCIPDTGPYVLAGAPWTSGPCCLDLCHVVSFCVCLATNKTVWCFFKYSLGRGCTTSCCKF